MVVVFFLIAYPYQRYTERKAAATKAAETTRECPDCLSKIPLKATRCMYCTSSVTPTA